MGKLGSVAACAWLATACAQAAAAPPAPLSAEELYERIAPSVWLVETRHAGEGGSLGSAVVIGPATLITNCHVVEKAQTIAVVHERRRFAAQLQYKDPMRDLCQLRVPGLAAPVVSFADPNALRVGAKVYAIGNPRGMELTLSDGLLSGLRRNAAGELQAIQISVPISPGSSGGGLFNSYGQLVGITTWGLKESQNVNFALPAHWIAELPRRAGNGTVAQADAGEQAPAPAPAHVPVPVPAPAPAPAPTPVPVPAPVSASSPLIVGRVFEYRLTDRITGNSQRVIYHVDRIEGGEIVFNSGARIENARGEVISMSGAIGGEADAAMPRGGWFRPGATVGSEWKLDYVTVPPLPRLSMALRARVAAEDILPLAGQQLRTLRLELTGYTDRAVSLPANASGRYRAVAWFAPDLQRIVRFEVSSRGGIMSSSFVIDEVLELVGIR
jgi:hypothetical protein